MALTGHPTPSISGRNLPNVLLQGGRMACSVAVRQRRLRATMASAEIPVDPGESGLEVTEVVSRYSVGAPKRGRVSDAKMARDKQSRVAERGIRLRPRGREAPAERCPRWCLQPVSYTH